MGALSAWDGSYATPHDPGLRGLRPCCTLHVIDVLIEKKNEYVCMRKTANSDDDDHTFEPPAILMIVDDWCDYTLPKMSNN